MSISSLTSPPSSTSSSQVVEKNHRRVRFSLPEAKLTLNDKRTVHGTTRYVNGTLINVTSTIHSTTGDSIVKAGTKNDVIKASCLKAGINGNGCAIPLNKEANSQYKVSLNIRPTSVGGIKDLPPSAITATTNLQGHRHSLPIASNGGGGGVVGSNIIINSSRRQISKSLAPKTLPIIENSFSNAPDKRSSSIENDSDEDDDEDFDHKVTNLTRYKSTDDLRDPNNFKIKNSSVLKLPEASNGAQKSHKILPNNLKVPEYSESKS